GGRVAEYRAQGGGVPSRRGQARDHGARRAPARGLGPGELRARPRPGDRRLVAALRAQSRLGRLLRQDDEAPRGVDRRARPRRAAVEHPLAHLRPRGVARPALRAARVFPAGAAFVPRLPARPRAAGAARLRAAARALDLEHRAALRPDRARRAARTAAAARPPARERPLLLGERAALAPRGRGARCRAAQGGARPARFRYGLAGRTRRPPVRADPEIQGRRRQVHERRGSDARRGLHSPHAGRAERAQGTRKREQTMTTPRPTPEQFAQAAKVAAAMRAEIGKALIGQPEVIDAVLCALLAGGHVLVEGVPGLGKTLLVKALARTISGSFGRIQFTPDLMPADVTGHTLYDPKNQVFTTRRGPVFVNLLLADEINRAPAKTQAALLEVMQEAQVTIEG